MDNLLMGQEIFDLGSKIGIELCVAFFLVKQIKFVEIVFSCLSLSDRRLLYSTLIEESGFM